MKSFSHIKSTIITMISNLNNKKKFEEVIYYKLLNYLQKNIFINTHAFKSLWKYMKKFIKYIKK